MTRRAVVDHLPVEQIGREYTAGQSVTGLINAYRVSESSIRKALRRAGVTLRPQRRRVGASGDPQAPQIPRVARDPCPRCGTRADIGCAHGWAP